MRSLIARISLARHLRSQESRWIHASRAHQKRQPEPLTSAAAKESSEAEKPKAENEAKEEPKVEAVKEETKVEANEPQEEKIGQEGESEHPEEERTTDSPKSESDKAKERREQIISRISTGVSLVGISGAAIWAYFNQDFVREKIRFFTEPSREKLLPDPVMYPGGQTLRTLVIELDDTLVHSMWSRQTGWRHTKRPGVEAFLAYLSSFYEIVLFTHQLSSYADPVLDRLDPNGYIMHRLYRDATKFSGGVHIKDLSKLNRDVTRTIIIDADSNAFQLQPGNGIEVSKWDRDPLDRTLLDLIPFLEYIVREDVKDVRTVLAGYHGTDIPTEFARRRAENNSAKQGRFGSLPFGGSLVGGSGGSTAASGQPADPVMPFDAEEPKEGSQGGSLFTRLRQR